MLKETRKGFFKWFHGELDGKGFFKIDCVQFLNILHFKGFFKFDNFKRSKVNGVDFL